MGGHFRGPGAIGGRRAFLQAAGLAALGLVNGTGGRAAPPAASERGKPTQFQIACMTLPYSGLPLQRALTGIRSAGFAFVAWGTSHLEADGRKVPVLAGDAPPAAAKELAQRCRDMGLEPVMLFGPSPEDVEGLTRRIQQAGAGGVSQVLTMGSTRGNDVKLWVKNLKQLAPIARDHKVRIVIKQHGGNTGTGVACAAITREVGDDAIKVSYDAGNVMDYQKIDPIPDLQKCADQVYSFCIKDHRTFPKDQDCGPGLGEIDHYRLLAPVAFTGRTMPLCCENIFAPVVARPSRAEGIDALARRAREFLELVIQGIQAA
ncbi:MAG: sugar phosphate isomerase/epimerase [Gemmataceae bacterium]|nr:sugar phosphate isomerase/epimerase [Gemmataceae bacterium]MDW8267458.1 TIM barrel protein [Gemmataceae bacterium]